LANTVCLFLFAYLPKNDRHQQQCQTSLMCNDVCFLVFSECNKQRFGHLANKEGYPWSMFNFFQAMGLDLLVPFGPMPYTMKGKIMDWTQ